MESSFNQLYMAALSLDIIIFFNVFFSRLILDFKNNSSELTSAIKKKIIYVF